MTRDHIIRMAMEADDYATHATDKNKSLDWYHVRDERFAALVAAAAKAEEREACAKLIEHLVTHQNFYVRHLCAAAIRSRGEVKP